MPKVSVYAIIDVKSSRFMAPVTQANDAVAVRSFKARCEQKDSIFYTNPEDFILYRIGEFNDESALIEATVPPVHICKALDFVEVKV